MIRKNVSMSACDNMCVFPMGSPTRAASQWLEARDGKETVSLPRPGTRSSVPAGLVLDTIFHRPRGISIQMGIQEGALFLR